MTEPPDDSDPLITDEDAPLPAAEEPARGTGGVGELVRRALLAGVGAVFMTEEQIRKTVNELKLPKEALGYLLGQAEKTRLEAGRILRKELRRFLNSDGFRRQLADVVSGLTLEIKAEVRLKPSGGPQVKDASVRLKPDAPDEVS